MKLGITEWVSDKAYAPGEVVVFINATFMCVRATERTLPLYNEMTSPLLEVYYPNESPNAHIDNEAWKLL